MKKTLSILVFNEPGVLNRITSVFSSRGFILEGLAVGVTEDIKITKVVIVVPCDKYTVDQVIQQLSKLVQIIDVKDVTNCPCVQRELLLIRVRAFPSTRSQILEIAQIFRCKIVDISDTTITLEITGDPGKTNVIQQLLNTYTILQIVRTGKIIMERYDGIDTEYLKTL